MELLAWNAPDAEFRVTVSAGTYVRALARDVGEKLGLGAHLVALRRETIGTLSVSDALPLDAIDAAAVQAATRRTGPHAASGTGRRSPRPRGARPRNPRARGRGGRGRFSALVQGGELVAVAEAVGDEVAASCGAGQTPDPQTLNA